MGLNVADAKVQHCQTAADVRALARAVLARKRARNRPPRRIPINDLTPGSFPVAICRDEQNSYERITYPSIKSIIEAVCQRYGVSLIDLVSERRTASVVRPRQIVCALARRLTPFSLPVIAQHLGGRDHTTIRHSCIKIDYMRGINPRFDAELLEIETALNAKPYVGQVVQKARHYRVSPWSNPDLAQRHMDLCKAGVCYAAIAATLSEEFGLPLSETACRKRAHRQGMPLRHRRIAHIRALIMEAA